MEVEILSSNLSSRVNLLLEGCSVNTVLANSFVVPLVETKSMLNKSVTEAFSKEDFEYLSKEVISENPEKGYRICKVTTRLNPNSSYEIAENLKGEFIGVPLSAQRFCVEMDMDVQCYEGSSVCSIGYCRQEKGWRGWSHRAMSPLFKEGFTVSSDSIICGLKPEWIPGYRCPSLDVAKEMAIEYAKYVS